MLKTEKIQVLILSFIIYTLYPCLYCSLLSSHKQDKNFNTLRQLILLGIAWLKNCVFVCLGACL